MTRSFATPLFGTLRRRTTRVLTFLAPMILAFSFTAISASAQGFGTTVGGMKKKIILHRKLPSAIRLSGPAFSITTTSRHPNQADVAQSLSDILETELIKHDSHLHADKNSPDVLITCTITQFDVPPAITSVRTESVVQNGRTVDVPVQYYRLTGQLEVAYQVKERKTGNSLDSQVLSAKYSREFQSGTNEATDRSLGSKVVDPFKRLAGKKTEAAPTPPTPVELRQQLVHDIVSQISARLVSTEESVEVYLARGKLDPVNKLAESNLWSRYLENLETMTPFPAPADDAYRIYNIGVANEALAYLSDDHAAAKKFLSEAAINYGKAIDLKPGEKYFLEPQTRIETAVAYYKKLDEQKSASAPPPPATPADPASVKNSGDTPAPAKKATTQQKTKSTSAPSPASNTPAVPALTNQKIIDMLKGGVDEDSIIATIHDAAATQFDLSPDGQIELAKNGVKGKILAAMRERYRRTAHKSAT